MKIIRYLFTVLLLMLCVQTWGQTSKSSLQRQKDALQKEMKRLDSAISANAKNQKANTVQLQNLHQKVNVRRGLINNINADIRQLDVQINEKSTQVAQLTRELDTLKNSYARMCVNYYKNKSTGLRLMYILSSQSFTQAYNRSRYIKEYSEAIRKRGEGVKQKNEETKVALSELQNMKAEKGKLLAEQKSEMDKLTADEKKVNTILASLKKNKRQLENDLKKNRNNAVRIQKAIDEIIRKEIEEQRRKEAEAARKAALAAKKDGKKATTVVKTTQKTSSTTDLAMTPEAKALSADFAQNKGKLPWPVERGTVFMHHGRQQYPGTTANIDVTGVLIAAPTGSYARSVFSGEVIRVQIKPDGLYMVFVRHGRYYSVYVDLVSVSVKQGDKVSVKQPLGRINTDKFENKTILNFCLYDGQIKQNPEIWLAK
ncbi:MAG: peptidoglycan DD-metalloendopeptidase family protein [Flavobacteriales bacterium]|nr:peptidoglycan DD-metalloendopeptidase family protein [Flavobacteriales bacterium]